MAVDTVGSLPASRQRIVESAKKGTQAEEKKGKNDFLWGRTYERISWPTAIGSGLMMSLCPLLLFYVITVCREHQCALSGPIMEVFVHRQKTLSEFIATEVPTPTLHAFAIYGMWLCFQLVLAVGLPGPIGYGQLTPAGHVLEYKVNGFGAWVVTHIAYVVLCYWLKIMSPTILYDHWPQLAWAMCTYGFFMTGVAFIKAHTFPSHPNDCKSSGSILYDLFMGIELNPRIGSFDFKLFHNGRIGIVLWTLVNLSFAAKQYENIGYVTNSMVILNVLHAVYVLDFFWNEDWYLRTIDICHDHFGFYLAWGDAVWLPVMYPLQSFYLVQNPVSLSPVAATLVMCLGLGGYFIFRSVNSQKNAFRASGGNCTIWGKPAQYVKAEFLTADGKKRTSTLLTSGWWGLSRHANYVGDLMMSLAFCLTCGIGHLLPYFYIIYMTILLVHRCYRDEERCRGKYGKYWDEYCKQVPYRIFPVIY